MSINHYENFPVASVVLPANLRKPVELIYRFARIADDIADEGQRPDSERLVLLARMGDELKLIEQRKTSRIELFRDLAVIVRQHNLPLGLFHDLLSAFSQDVEKKRYANLHEVLDYCRRSANPIGRLLLELYGAATPQNLKWSDHVCSSLQIINFLQDIAIDHAIGRIYMPQDELARFNVSEAQIARRDTGGGWRDFMNFQLKRTRRMLWDGAPLGRALKGRIGLELRLIIAGGDRILTKIRAARFDVYRHRPVLRMYDWPLMLLRTLSIH